MREQDIIYTIDKLKYFRREIEDLAAKTEQVSQDVYVTLSRIAIGDGFIPEDFDMMRKSSVASLNEFIWTCRNMESMIEEAFYRVEANMIPCVYGPPDDPDIILE